MEVSSTESHANPKWHFKKERRKAKGRTRSIYRRAGILHECPEENTDTFIHGIVLSDTVIDSSFPHIVITTRDTSSSNQKMQDNIGPKETKKKRHSCLCKGLKYALLSCYKSGMKCSMKSVSEPDDDECYMPVSVEKKILPECNTHGSPKDYSHSPQVPLFSVGSRSTTQDESNQWNNSNIDATKGKELVAVTNNRRCHEMVDSIPLHTWMTVSSHTSGLKPTVPLWIESNSLGIDAARPLKATKIPNILGTESGQSSWISPTCQGSPSAIPGVFLQTSVEKIYPLKLSETHLPRIKSMIQVYKVSSHCTLDIPKSAPPGTVFSFRPRRQPLPSSPPRKKRTSIPSDESGGSADLRNASQLRIEKVEYEDKKGRKKQAYIILPGDESSRETSSVTSSDSDSTTSRAPKSILISSRIHRRRSPAGSEGVGVTLRDARRSVLVPHEDGAVPYPFIPESDMPTRPSVLMAKGGDDEDDEGGEDDEDYEDDEGGEDDEDYEDDEGDEDDEDYEDDEGGEDDEDYEDDEGGEDDEDYEDDEGGEDDEYDDEDFSDDDYEDDGEDFDSEQPSNQEKETNGSEKKECAPCQLMKALKVFSTLFKPPCPNNPSCPAFPANGGLCGTSSCSTMGQQNQENNCGNGQFTPFQTMQSLLLFSRMFNNPGQYPAIRPGYGGQQYWGPQPCPRYTPGGAGMQTMPYGTPGTSTMGPMCSMGGGRSGNGGGQTRIIVSKSACGGGGGGRGSAGSVRKKNKTGRSPPLSRACSRTNGGGSVCSRSSTRASPGRKSSRTSRYSAGGVSVLGRSSGGSTTGSRPYGRRRSPRVSAQQEGWTSQLSHRSPSARSHTSSNRHSCSAPVRHSLTSPVSSSRFGNRTVIRKNSGHNDRESLREHPASHSPSSGNSSRRSPLSISTHSPLGQIFPPARSATKSAERQYRPVLSVKIHKKATNAAKTTTPTDNHPPDTESTTPVSLKGNDEVPQSCASRRTSKKSAEKNKTSIGDGTSKKNDEFFVKKHNAVPKPTNQKTVNIKICLNGLKNADETNQNSENAVNCNDIFNDNFLDSLNLMNSFADGTPNGRENRVKSAPITQEQSEITGKRSIKEFILERGNVIIQDDRIRRSKLKELEKDMRRRSTDMKSVKSDDTLKIAEHDRLLSLSKECLNTADRTNESCNPESAGTTKYITEKKKPLIEKTTDVFQLSKIISSLQENLIKHTSKSEEIMRKISKESSKIEKEIVNNDKEQCIEGLKNSRDVKKKQIISFNTSSDINARKTWKKPFRPINMRGKSASASGIHNTMSTGAVAEKSEYKKNPRRRSSCICAKASLSSTSKTENNQAATKTEKKQASSKTESKHVTSKRDFSERGKVSTTTLKVNISESKDLCSQVSPKENRPEKAQKYSMAIIKSSGGATTDPPSSISGSEHQSRRFSAVLGLNRRLSTNNDLKIISRVKIPVEIDKQKSPRSATPRKTHTFSVSHSAFTVNQREVDQAKIKRSVNSASSRGKISAASDNREYTRSSGKCYTSPLRNFQDRVKVLSAHERKGITPERKRKHSPKRQRRSSRHKEYQSLIKSNFVKDIIRSIEKRESGSRHHHIKKKPKMSRRSKIRREESIAFVHNMVNRDVDSTKLERKRSANSRRPSHSTVSKLRSVKSADIEHKEKDDVVATLHNKKNITNDKKQCNINANIKESKQLTSFEANFDNADYSLQHENKLMLTYQTERNESKVNDIKQRDKGSHKVNDTSMDKNKKNSATGKRQMILNDFNNNALDVNTCLENGIDCVKAVKRHESGRRGSSTPKMISTQEKKSRVKEIGLEHETKQFPVSSPSSRTETAQFLNGNVKTERRGQSTEPCFQSLVIEQEALQTCEGTKGPNTEVTKHPKKYFRTIPIKHVTKEDFSEYSMNNSFPEVKTNKEESKLEIDGKICEQQTSDNREKNDKTKTMTNDSILKSEGKICEQQTSDDREQNEKNMTLTNDSTLKSEGKICEQQKSDDREQNEKNMTLTNDFTLKSEGKICEQQTSDNREQNEKKMTLTNDSTLKSEGKVCEQPTTENREKNEKSMTLKNDSTLKSEGKICEQQKSNDREQNEKNMTLTNDSTLKSEGKICEQGTSNNRDKNDKTKTMTNDSNLKSVANSKKKYVLSASKGSKRELNSSHKRKEVKYLPHGDELQTTMAKLVEATVELYKGGKESASSRKNETQSEHKMIDASEKSLNNTPKNTNINSSEEFGQSQSDEFYRLQSFPKSIHDGSQNHISSSSRKVKSQVTHDETKHHRPSSTCAINQKLDQKNAHVTEIQPSLQNKIQTMQNIEQNINKTEKVQHCEKPEVQSPKYVRNDTKYIVECMNEKPLIERKEKRIKIINESEINVKNTPLNSEKKVDVATESGRQLQEPKTLKYDQNLNFKEENNMTDQTRKCEELRSSGNNINSDNRNMYSKHSFPENKFSGHEIGNKNQQGTFIVEKSYGQEIRKYMDVNDLTNRIPSNIENAHDHRYNEYHLDLKDEEPQNTADFISSASYFQKINIFKKYDSRWPNEVIVDKNSELLRKPCEKELLYPSYTKRNTAFQGKHRHFEPNSDLNVAMGRRFARKREESPEKSSMWPQVHQEGQKYLSCSAPVASELSNGRPIFRSPFRPISKAKALSANAILRARRNKEYIASLQQRSRSASCNRCGMINDPTAILKMASSIALNGSPRRTPISDISISKQKSMDLTVRNLNKQPVVTLPRPRVWSAKVTQNTPPVTIKPLDPPPPCPPSTPTSEKCFLANKAERQRAVKQIPNHAILDPRSKRKRLVAVTSSISISSSRHSSNKSISVRNSNNVVKHIIASDEDEEYLNRVLPTAKNTRDLENSNVTNFRQIIEETLTEVLREKLPHIVNKFRSETALEEKMQWCGNRWQRPWKSPIPAKLQKASEFPTVYRKPQPSYIARKSSMAISNQNTSSQRFATTNEKSATQFNNTGYPSDDTRSKSIVNFYKQKLLELQDLENLKRCKISIATKSSVEEKKIDLGSKSQKPRSAIRDSVVFEEEPRKSASGQKAGFGVRKTQKLTSLPLLSARKSQTLPSTDWNKKNLSRRHQRGEGAKLSISDAPEVPPDEDPVSLPTLPSVPSTDKFSSTPSTRLALARNPLSSSPGGGRGTSEGTAQPADTSSSLTHSSSFTGSYSPVYSYDSTSAYDYDNFDAYKSDAMDGNEEFESKKGSGYEPAYEYNSSERPSATMSDSREKNEKKKKYSRYRRIKDGIRRCFCMKCRPDSSPYFKTVRQTQIRSDCEALNITKESSAKESCHCAEVMPGPNTSRRSKTCLCNIQIVEGVEGTENKQECVCSVGPPRNPPLGAFSVPLKEEFPHVTTEGKSTTSISPTYSCNSESKNVSCTFTDLESGFDTEKSGSQLCILQGKTKSSLCPIFPSLFCRSRLISTARYSYYTVNRSCAISRTCILQKKFPFTDKSNDSDTTSFCDKLPSLLAGNAQGDGSFNTHCKRNEILQRKSFNSKTRGQQNRVPWIGTGQEREPSPDWFSSLTCTCDKRSWDNDNKISIIRDNASFGVASSLDWSLNCPKEEEEISWTEQMLSRLRSMIGPQRGVPQNNFMSPGGVTGFCKDTQLGPTVSVCNTAPSCPAAATPPAAPCASISVIPACSTCTIPAAPTAPPKCATTQPTGVLPTIITCPMSGTGGAGSCCAGGSLGGTGGDVCCSTGGGLTVIGEDGCCSTGGGLAGIEGCVGGSCDGNCCGGTPCCANTASTDDTTIYICPKKLDELLEDDESDEDTTDCCCDCKKTSQCDSKPKCCCDTEKKRRCHSKKKRRCKSKSSCHCGSKPTCCGDSKPTCCGDSKPTCVCDNKPMCCKSEPTCHNNYTSICLSGSRTMCSRGNDPTSCCHSQLACCDSESTCSSDSEPPCCCESESCSSDSEPTCCCNSEPCCETGSNSCCTRKYKKPFQKTIQIVQCPNKFHSIMQCPTHSNCTATPCSKVVRICPSKSSSKTCTPTCSSAQQASCACSSTCSEVSRNSSCSSCSHSRSILTACPANPCLTTMKRCQTVIMPPCKTQCPQWNSDCVVYGSVTYCADADGCACNGCTSCRSEPCQSVRKKSCVKCTRQLSGCGTRPAASCSECTAPVCPKPPCARKVCFADVPPCETNSACSNKCDDPLDILVLDDGVPTAAFSYPGSCCGVQTAAPALPMDMLQCCANTLINPMEQALPRNKAAPKVRVVENFGPLQGPGGTAPFAPPPFRPPPSLFFGNSNSCHCDAQANNLMNKPLGGVQHHVWINNQTANPICQNASTAPVCEWSGSVNDLSQNRVVISALNTASKAWASINDGEAPQCEEICQEVVDENWGLNQYRWENNNHKWTRNTQNWVEMNNNWAESNIESCPCMGNDINMCVSHLPIAPTIQQGMPLENRLIDALKGTFDMSSDCSKLGEMNSRFGDLPRNFNFREGRLDKPGEGPYELGMASFEIEEKCPCASLDDDLEGHRRRSTLMPQSKVIKAAKIMGRHRKRLSM